MMTLADDAFVSVWSLALEARWSNALRLLLLLFLTGLLRGTAEHLQNGERPDQ